MNPLHKKFPWLANLGPICDRLIDTLNKKESSYEGSWQKRGGVGAYMMTARKTDRLEAITSQHGYDIFAALAANTGDIKDDLEDLICYLLLILAEHQRRQTQSMYAGEPTLQRSGGSALKGTTDHIGELSSQPIFVSGMPVYSFLEEASEPGPGYVNQDPPTTSVISVRYEGGK